MKWMKKIASGALALLMAASLTACGGDTSWAYRSENATVTSGMYVGLSIQALNSAFAVDGYDSSKSPFKQDLEGKDGTQWIQDKAAELSREYLTVEEKFQEMGLSFTDEEESSFNNNVELYWTTLRMSSTYEGEGCGKEYFAKILRNSAKKNKIFEAVYGEGGEKEVPVDELKTIFATDYAKGTYITVSLTDSDGNALTGADLIAKIQGEGWMDFDVVITTPDMMGQVGTPVIAVESGYVEALGWNRYGGWRIGIRSFDKKRYYYYAHLRQNYPYQSDLKEGSIVTAGDVIGYLGRTGYSTTENTNNITTPHLHFGLQLIFDESQKEGNNEIWINCYELVKFLRLNQSETVKVEGTKEWTRVYGMKDPGIPGEGERQETLTQSESGGSFADEGQENEIRE